MGPQARPPKCEVNLRFLNDYFINEDDFFCQLMLQWCTIIGTGVHGVVFLGKYAHMRFYV